jgi:hypothetical protein
MVQMLTYPHLGCKMDGSDNTHYRNHPSQLSA